MTYSQHGALSLCVILIEWSLVGSAHTMPCTSRSGVDCEASGALLVQLRSSSIVRLASQAEPEEELGEPWGPYEDDAFNVLAPDDEPEEETSLKTSSFTINTTKNDGDDDDEGDGNEPTPAPTAPTPPAPPTEAPAPTPPTAPTAAPAPRPTAAPAPRPTAAPGPSTGDQSLPIEYEFFKLLNKLRAKGDTCPDGTVFAANPVPLEWDCRLWKCSQLHSQDQAAPVAKMQHAGKDGSTPFERAKRQGTSANAENVAMGQRTATSVLAGWQSSNGHCLNQMNPKMKTVGLGWTTGNYWTQMLRMGTDGNTNECVP